MEMVMPKTPRKEFDDLARKVTARAAGQWAAEGELEKSGDILAARAARVGKEGDVLATLLAGVSRKRPAEEISSDAGEDVSAGKGQTGQVPKLQRSESLVNPFGRHRDWVEQGQPENSLKGSAVDRQALLSLNKELDRKKPKLLISCSPEGNKEGSEWWGVLSKDSFKKSLVNVKRGIWGAIEEEPAAELGRKNAVVGMVPPGVLTEALVNALSSSSNYVMQPSKHGLGRTQSAPADFYANLTSNPRGDTPRPKSPIEGRSYSL
jgi:hypothetical protein